METVLPSYWRWRFTASNFGRVGMMLFAAIIFVMSVAAMVQFAVLSWRAGLLRTVARPLDGESDSMARQTVALLHSQDFAGLSALQEICPDLSGSKAPKLHSVHLYYKALRGLSALGNAVLPNTPAAAWARSEMALCTRFAAAVLAERLERNRAVLAEARPR